MGSVDFISCLYVCRNSESTEELRAAEDAGGREEEVVALTGVAGRHVEVSPSVSVVGATSTTELVVGAESMAGPTSPGGGLHEEDDPGATEVWYGAPLTGAEGVG